MQRRPRLRPRWLLPARQRTRWPHRPRQRRWPRLPTPRCPRSRRLSTPSMPMTRRTRQSWSGRRPRSTRRRPTPTLLPGRRTSWLTPRPTPTRWPRTRRRPRMLPRLPRRRQRTRPRSPQRRQTNRCPVWPRGGSPRIPLRAQHRWCSPAATPSPIRSAMTALSPFSQPPRQIPL